jgi:hypothetical protein
MYIYRVGQAPGGGRVGIKATLCEYNEGNRETMHARSAALG